jgi:peptidoglycan/xylan/chitin deacetylase (PgdA/CDA1 family)
VRGGLVLLYHRVVSLDHDPQQLAVTPARFADHLEVLGRDGVPMTLAGLVATARAGTMPRGAFALTFDDGYADVLEIAAPMLAAASIPATVFVTARAADDHREFWWDEVERQVLLTPHLPSPVRLPIDDAEMAWETATPAQRRLLYEALCERLRGLSAASRRRTLDALAALTGVPTVARASHRRLSTDQVIALSRMDGITIGSHSISHPSLSRLPRGAQRGEVAGGKQALESCLGQPVTAMAFPFGDTGDDDVAEAGVTLACTTDADSVRADTDPLRIPRLVVRNWTRDEFSERWAAWTA